MANLDPKALVRLILPPGTTLTSENTTDGAMHEIVPAIAAIGVSPVVRLPGTEAWMVKRKL